MPALGDAGWMLAFLSLRISRNVRRAIDIGVEVRDITYSSEDEMFLNFGERGRLCANALVGVGWSRAGAILTAGLLPILTDALEVCGRDIFKTGLLEVFNMYRIKCGRKNSR